MDGDTAEEVSRRVVTFALQLSAFSVSPMAGRLPMSISAAML